MDDGWRAIVDRLSAIVLCGALALSARPAWSAEESAPGLDLSTKKDALRVIDQGIQWLKSRQNVGGYWPTEPQPVVTAFATRAILRDPAREPGKMDASAAKGLKFIASCAQKGGNINAGPHPAYWSPYNTAASLLALDASHQESYVPLILAARRFLVSIQNRRENSPQFGGWAANGCFEDLETTALVIEALSATQRLSTADADKNKSAPADPDWAAAVAFLSNCQVLRLSERQSSQDLGGFFHWPGQWRPHWHCDGTATALGLTALLESNVARRDPRVLAAVDWLRANYTLDEEPGVSSKHEHGLYFYYHSLAEALSLYGEEPLLCPEKPDATGAPARLDWRRDLTIRLISTQRADENGRGYWEANAAQAGAGPPLPADVAPVLATAFSVLTLEILVSEPLH